MGNSGKAALVTRLRSKKTAKIVVEFKDYFYNDGYGVEI